MSVWPAEPWGPLDTQDTQTFPTDLRLLADTSVLAVARIWVPGPGRRLESRAGGPAVSLDSRGHSIACSLGRAGQAVSATALRLPATAHERGADGQGGGSDLGTFSGVNGGPPTGGRPCSVLWPGRPGRVLRKASGSPVTWLRRRERVSFNHVQPRREDPISSVSDCFLDERCLVVQTWAGCERRAGSWSPVPLGVSWPQVQRQRLLLIELKCRIEEGWPSSEGPPSLSPACPLWPACQLGGDPRSLALGAPWVAARVGGWWGR